MVPGKSRVVTTALSAVLASTLMFGVAGSAGAATRDVNEAVESAKQETRALEKAKKAARKSAKELKSATAASKQAGERLSDAHALVIRSRANLERAREAVNEVSVEVDVAFEQTKELKPDGGLIEVAADAADVAAGSSEQPVLDAAVGAVKAGLTGALGPVMGLLEPLGEVVSQEAAEADQQFAAAQTREQVLRRRKMEAAAAHRAVSVEWIEATAGLEATEAAVKKATKAEKKAIEQEAKDAKAVKKANKAATKAKSAEKEARKKAEQAKKKEAAERAAAGRGSAAGNASRSAAVSGRARPGTGSISSRYGMRSHPITGAYKLHSGTDYAYGDGKAYAAAAGTVTSVGYDGAYGNMVTISHGNGTETRYAHLASASVSSGQKISAGQVVGNIGSTGYATGPHLHFEVLIGGNFVNPEGWLGG